MEDGRPKFDPSLPKGNFRGHAKQYVWSEKPDPLLAEVGPERRVENINAASGCRSQ